MWLAYLGVLIRAGWHGNWKMSRNTQAQFTSRLSNTTSVFLWDYKMVVYISVKALYLLFMPKKWCDEVKRPREELGNCFVASHGIKDFLLWFGPTYSIHPYDKLCTPSPILRSSVRMLMTLISRCWPGYPPCWGWAHLLVPCTILTEVYSKSYCGVK